MDKDPEASKKWKAYAKQQKKLSAKVKQLKEEQVKYYNQWKKENDEYAKA